MPPKKKSKPSFKVPEDLETAPQAGWVYRSESTPAAEQGSVSKSEKAKAEPVEPPAESASAPAEPQAARTGADREPNTPPTAFRAEPAKSESNGILDLTAKTISSGMATIGNALMLGAAILTAPFRVGLWIVGFRDRD